MLEMLLFQYYEGAHNVQTWNALLQLITYHVLCFICCFSICDCYVLTIHVQYNTEHRYSCFKGLLQGNGVRSLMYSRKIMCAMMIWVLKYIVWITMKPNYNKLCYTSRLKRLVFPNHWLGFCYHLLRISKSHASQSRWTQTVVTIF